MELDPQEKSHIWWKGTIKGALKGLAIGMIVGAATALLLGGLCLVSGPFLPVFGGFISMHAAPAVLTWSAFSMAPLALFSGFSGLIGGLLGSGKAAVNAATEKLHHQEEEMKLSELDGREQVLENMIVPKSRNLETIIARGPANKISFSEAETARANAPSTNSIQ